ncbi:hypothetical protein [Streptomyces sp. NPDC094472]|uniref:hypothetical protein n=1 Tax=Streptomyces sp. NPDC094472 TaxID=3155080 RepID=UPI003331FD3A
MSARDDLYLFVMVGKVQEDGNRKMAARKLDAHRAEVLAEAKAEVAAWLLKKAGEYRATGKRQREADAVEVMASKIDRGAVRLFLDEAGKVSPAGAEIIQAADTTPLVVHWDRLVMPPTGEDDHTVIACTADDGRPVALFLTDEHRQALGEELLTPLGDEARELLAEIRRRGRAITVSQAHRWLNTRSVPRAHVRALLRRLAEHGDLVVREERGRRTYVENDAGGEGR